MHLDSLRHWAILSVLAILGAENVLGATAQPPNIVIILADDLGYGDVGCYGSQWAPTPHLDNLAKRGVRFTDGYVTAAVCSPSRAGLLTGRYQQRFGHEANPGFPEHENFGLPASEKIIAQYLKPRGYRSAAIGKWHLGSRPGFHPLDRGFDEFFGLLAGGGAYLTKQHPGGVAVPVENEDDGLIIADRANPTDSVTNWHRSPVFRGRQAVQEERYLTDALAEEAVEFIRRSHSGPYFLYLAPNAVHTPLQATANYLDRVAHIESEKRRMLAAMIAAFDDLVGKVMSAIDENTIVFFLSDNGCPVVTGAGSNQPLSGQKGTYFEGGIRVPFMVFWPEQLRGGQVFRSPVSSLDLLPTIMAAAKIRDQGPLDGVDLLPFLKSGNAPQRALYWRSGEARAVRMGKWKLLELGGALSCLYDLEIDIGERENRSAEFPDIVAELRKSWTTWSTQMSSPVWPTRPRVLTVNGVSLAWPN